jgi:hypothetical protein
MENRYKICTNWPPLTIAGLLTFLAVVSSARAQDWGLTSALNLPWQTIACSADGNKLVVTGYAQNEFGIYGPLSIYTSADSGGTWTNTSAPTSYWGAIASSADGSRIVAISGVRAFGVQGLIYTSTNSGASWTQSSAPTNAWTSVASSADGTTMVAGSIGIYMSTNSGNSWTQTTAPSNKWWKAVASSADGSRLLAANEGHYDNDGNWIDGLLYISTNAGNTWDLTSAPQTNWSSIACSADGVKLAACVEWGPIYTSTNSGTTWTETTAPAISWYSVASSADGNRLAAAGSDGNTLWIYSSTNAGATWAQTSQVAYGFLVVCSADGERRFAIGGGGIYTSPSPARPSLPRLSIAPSAGRLGLSWLVPSTSFALQENLDLSTTNWTDVPTPPALNFTNLHYEITVSATNPGNFYRLRQR